MLESDVFAIKHLPFMSLAMEGTKKVIYSWPRVRKTKELGLVLFICMLESSFCLPLGMATEEFIRSEKIPDSFPKINIMKPHKCCLC